MKEYQETLNGCYAQKKETNNPLKYPDHLAVIYGSSKVRLPREQANFFADRVSKRIFKIRRAAPATPRFVYYHELTELPQTLKHSADRSAMPDR